MIRHLEAPSIADNGYPTTSKRYMRETEWHRDLMFQIIQTLQWWFASMPDVHVSGNLMVFYEKDELLKHISPDVFVVRGVGKHYRDNYLLWEEKPIDLVIEIASKTTHKADRAKKLKLYESKLGVREYYLFDPDEKFFEPSFQGFRRVGEHFEPMATINGRFASDVLGLELERVGNALRFRSPINGKMILLPAGIAQAERKRAEQAVKDLIVARIEIENLRRKLKAQN